MAITFDPTSLDFGGVTVNTQGARSLTITNSGNTAAAVNAPGAPFAMDPAVAVVPAAANGTPGAISVVVKFVPLGEQPYVGSIACDGASCALSGAGVPATVEETTTTKKSLLINVPDFSDGVFEKRRSPDAVEAIMNSFLRLGAFDYAVEPPKAKELLNLIHQAGPPGDPARTEKYGAAWEADPDFLKAPPFQPRASATDAANAGNGDVFFFDDVRIRDVDVVGPSIAESSIKGHGLTMEQRQAESARLYSRGGWRDHSDGNRISTTYGDKVEVIRGNYKMIVMGRQDDPGEAMGWEVSGSHVTDYAPGTMPGAVYWHQWVPDYKFTDSEGVVRTGVWLLVNTTENVYEYARYGGNFREERWGDLLETYVGSENPPLGQVATDDVMGSAGHDPPARLPGISYDYPASTPLGRTTPNWPQDNKDQVRSNPHIVEKTWARRIDSWTGSALCPVGEIHEKTFAGKIYGDTGSAARRVSEIHEETWATDTFETVNVTNKIQGNTIAGSIFEATTAGTIWEATTTALHTELHVGPHISVEVGALLDVFVGVKAEIQLGWGVAISTSGFNDYDFPFKKALTAEDVKTSLASTQQSLDAKITALNGEATYLKKRVISLSVQMLAVNLNLGL